MCVRFTHSVHFKHDAQDALTDVDLKKPVTEVGFVCLRAPLTCVDKSGSSLTVSKPISQQQGEEFRISSFSEKCMCVFPA